jgi:hypothetical protein
VRLLYKGSTIFEIILSVFSLTLIGGIALYVMNFNRAANHLRDLQIQSEMNTLLKNINQYFIAEGEYPAPITSVYTPICTSDIKTNCIQFKDKFINDYLYIAADNLSFQSSYSLSLYSSEYKVSAQTRGASGKLIITKF